MRHDGLLMPVDNCSLNVLEWFYLDNVTVKFHSGDTIMERRDFVKLLAAQSVVGLVGATAPVMAESSQGDFCFVEPFDGGIVHVRHGHPVVGLEKGGDGTDRLRIAVSGKAPVSSQVEVIAPDGTKIATTRKGEQFSCEVVLTETVSEIKAICRQGGTERIIRTRPIWHKTSFPRFTFQIDDCGFFLRDLCQQRPKRLLDHFFLANLKKIHRDFGTKVVLNCFYSPQQLDFDMSMMPNVYKSEFEKNADWLRLTFHSKTEFPNDPYLAATPEKLIADYDEVMTELRRFAGCAAIPTSCTHFANMVPEAWKPMYSRGTRYLCLEPSRTRGRMWCSYQVPQDVFEYVLDHEAWKDFNSGLIFMKTDIIINNVALNDIVPSLQKVWDLKAEREVLGLLTHEQYCWKDYKRYLPDHFERIAAACRFAVEHGHKPIWHLDTYPGI